MNPLHYMNISIPIKWTGEQARLICDFLEEISAHIWQVHEHAILDTIQSKNISRKTKEEKQPTNQNNDLPF